MKPYESKSWREHRERERQRRLATRMLAAIVTLTLLAALWLCVGCADMSRTPSERPAPRADGSRAKWQRQWELLAAAAESPTADEEHSRVLDAMEHAAMMRDGRFFTEVIEDLDTDGDGRIDSSRVRLVDITDAPHDRNTTDRESGARNWNASAAGNGGSISAAPADSATSRAGSAPSDNTAPTLARAAEALGELATKER